MRVSLTSEEYDVLRALIGTTLPEPKFTERGKAVLELSEDLAVDYRNFCSDELDLTGFDLDYVPTIRGRILDSLIDKLFTG